MKLRDVFRSISSPMERRRRPGPDTVRRRYADFAQALSDCTRDGYENTDIVNVVVEKTKRYRDGLSAKNSPVQLKANDAYSLCSLLAAWGSDEINVLDFGGAAGAHYFAARAVLPSSCRLNWVVVETSAMAEKAQVLANEELRFSNDITQSAASLGRLDVLHTSGTLQCVEKPYEFLEKLISVSAKHIMFSRLGLTQGNSEVITIHESWLSWNGPGPMPEGFTDRKVFYPFVFSREAVFREILGSDYEIVMTFDDTSGVIPVDDEPIVGFGLFARRRI